MNNLGKRKIEMLTEDEMTFLGKDPEPFDGDSVIAEEYEYIGSSLNEDGNVELAYKDRSGNEISPVLIHDVNLADKADEIGNYIAKVMNSK